MLLSVVQSSQSSIIGFLFGVFRMRNCGNAIQVN